MIHSYRVLVPVGVLALLVTETALTFGCFLLAVHLVVDDPGLFLMPENGLIRLAIVVATLILAMHLQGLYSQEVKRPSLVLLFQKLCLALGVAFVTQGFISYVDATLQVPLRVVAPGGAMAIAAVLVLRSSYGTAIWKIAERRILFVGTSPLWAEAAAFLNERPYLGLHLIGYVGEPGSGGGPGAGNVGDLAELDQIVKAARPDFIVLGTERGNRQPIVPLFELQFAGLKIQQDFAFLEQTCGYLSAKQLEPDRLIFSDELKGRQDRFSEVVDFGLAALFTFVSMPAMAAAAVAIKLSSSGPVLERLPRVGKGGEAFDLFRFRSTYPDAGPDAGPNAAGDARGKRGDLRLTAPGRFLRASGLEALPQLFNVLRGEMALVGPRPERPELVRALSDKIPFYCQRHVVKPGLTGWAQIKYEDRPQDAVHRLEYDLYYIKCMSQMLNQYIIFRAAISLVRRWARR